MTEHSSTDGASRDELRDELWAQVDDLGTLADELDDADFDRPSLCDGWAVRDVFGHMCVGHTTSGPVIAGKVLRYRGNMAKGSFEMSKAWAAQRTPAEIRDFWRRELVEGRARRGIAKTIRWDDSLVDHLVHEQDVRRAVDRPRPLPERRLRLALDRAPSVHSPLFSVKKKVRGLRLEATDLDWSWGDGPVVSGPGEAVLMAVSGRTVAFRELDGPGVAVLSGRM